MTDTDRTRVVVLECPMSWCKERFAGKGDPERAEVEAAEKLNEHVDADHSAKDIDTLREGEP